MRIIGRERRKLRIRRKISGTAERPRLTIFRSAKHMYAQAIDDTIGKTVAFASTLSFKSGEKSEHMKKSDAAKRVGKTIAERLLENNIKKVVFDRNGYLYHGCTKALADSARETGLQF